MRYLHLNCLKEWIKSKCHIIENENCKTYIWENLFCELCKDKYPDFVTKKRRKIKVLEFEIPEHDDYILLESFQKHDEKKVRFLHVINFSGNKRRINIGRANNCETRIIDISVSRQHSLIRKENDGFWICDANSKFGTLLYKNTPCLLKVDEPQYVQCGRTLMIFMLEKPCCNCLASCLRPVEVESGIDYEMHMERFPEEYKDLYHEIYNDEVPIVEALKKGKGMRITPSNSLHKVVPIPDLSNGAQIVTQPKMNHTTELVSANTPRTRIMGRQHTSGGNEDRDLSNLKSRNRSRFQHTNVILEHEEEGKGTIDFRHRTPFREEAKAQRFMTYREESKHQRNESISPLMHNVYNGDEEPDQDSEQKDHDDQSVQNEESKLDRSEESKGEHNFQNIDDAILRSIERVEDRKRSISAREPTRKIQMTALSSHHKLPAPVQQNNLFEVNSRPVFENSSEANREVVQDEEDIEELINRFSNDLELQNESNNRFL